MCAYDAMTKGNNNVDYSDGDDDEIDSAFMRRNAILTEHTQICDVCKW